MLDAIAELKADVAEIMERLVRVEKTMIAMQGTIVEMQESLSHVKFTTDAIHQSVVKQGEVLFGARMST